jgi:ankyrin repeat protein
MSEVADNLQLLSQCVREGRHEEAEALLPFASPCVYASAATPWTALHLAAHHGRLRVLRVFLRFICNAAGQQDPRLNVDVRDYRGCTPLHRAARAGRVTAARMLLSAGARRDVVDAEGKIPVVAAAARGHAEIVRLLLERGQTTGVRAREALAEALGVAQCWKTAQAVLRVCPDAARDGTAATTALLSVCSALPTESPFRMVQLLCNMGANVDAVDEDGKSPLHFAASQGWLDVASFLIGNCKSSAINRVDSNEDTPLLAACEFAARHKRPLLVRLLLRQGANPNVTHESLTFSPLNAAACRKHVDTARALIDAGARMCLKAKTPGQRETPAVLRAALRRSRAHLKWFARKFTGIGSWSEPDGYSLFHAAAWSGDLGTMKLVVRLGAHPKRVCADGRSALHSFAHGFTTNSKYYGHCLSPCEDVVDYLVKTCRLNPEEQLEPAGYTPLHIAAIVEGCAEVVRALINSGAAIDCRCAKGMYFSLKSRKTAPTNTCL